MSFLIKNQSRLMAVALLVLAIAVLGGFAIWPNIYASKIRGELSAIENEMRTFNARAENARMKSAPGERMGDGGNSPLLNGATVGVAGAQLQNVLLGHIARNRGNLHQIQILEPVAEDNSPQRIPIDVRLTTDTKALRDIIVDIERSYPLMFISDLSIEPVRQDFENERRGTAPNGPLQLSATMRVSAYLGEGEAP